jgi:hypothetical protein
VENHILERNIPFLLQAFVLFGIPCNRLHEKDSSTACAICAQIPMLSIRRCIFGIVQTGLLKH